RARRGACAVRNAHAAAAARARRGSLRRAPGWRAARCIVDLEPALAGRHRGVAHMKLSILLAAALAAATSAANAAAPATYSLADFAKVEKIDTHVHITGDLPEFMKRAAADNFRMLDINVNYGDFASLDVQQRDAIKLSRAYPDRVAWAATFDAHDSAS